MIKKLYLAFSSVKFSFLLWLPQEFSKFRVRYYNKLGCKIHEKASISPNVRIRGCFEMGEGSSIAQNCSISGETSGVFLGKNVMIGPNVVIVAFNHGMSDFSIPMVKQKNLEAPVIIEDDVWIGANATLGMGVRIGKGSVVGANSFVNKNIPPFCVVGGVPAKILKSRIK